MDLMVGKLALKLSYLVLPFLRPQWELLGSNTSHGKRRQIERAALVRELSDQAAPLTFTLMELVSKVSWTCGA